MSRTPDILQRFGVRLRALRQQAELSQEALADICELDRTYISGIERGHRNVSLRNIAVIARALDLTLSELLEGV
ncbi:MAG TPA: helix-turn-helix transcriptional regulator [Planctomycetaceae bacterium]|nr:helix-turn-helix transcriptional regulator [Planctomycetaceae bacterium]